MRQQIQTAGEIAAVKTEEEDETSSLTSTEASNDVSEADPAPDTSLPSGAGAGDTGSPDGPRPVWGVVATRFAPAMMRKRSTGDCVFSASGTGPRSAACISCRD